MDGDSSEQHSYLNGVDGLLSQEREDLAQRVQDLTSKVNDQANDIVCLKTALADVIRRLAQVEASSQNNILPSKPTFRSNRKSSASDRKLHMNPLENANLVPHRTSSISISKSMHSPRNSTSMKKWSSLSNSADLSNPALTPFKSSGSVMDRSSGSVRVYAHNRRSTSHSNLTARPSGRGSREAVWNQDEGYLKIFLKGRAVSLYAPSSLSEYTTSKMGESPSEKLQLEWVYGYRGRDCRSNLYFLPTGEVVYFVAAVVVLYNVEEGMQRFYCGHNDDVKCIAIHPDKIRIATGQVAGHEKKEGKKKRSSSNDVTEVDESWGFQQKQIVHRMSQNFTSRSARMRPHIRIWDSVSLNTLHVIGLGDFDRAVCCVSFSKLDGGCQLVAIDEANEHVISVWDLTRDRPHKITETKSSTEPVLAVEFHPSEKNSIVSCGKSQLTFWSIEGGALSKKQGIYDKHEKPKFVLCLAFADNGDVITGDSNGNILIWGKGGNRISQAVNGAHEGGVFSVCVMKDGTVLSGGGKDRKIVQWDSGYRRTGLETELPELFGPVRTLSQGKGNLILVGTTRNCILQGSLELKLNPIVQGHMDELWGLATHPSQHQFLTCGADKHIYLWDSLSHSVIWCKEVSDPLHSCCFHPDGNLVAIGTQSSRWLVVDLATHEILGVHSDGTEQIECIQYSPDGKYLALGSRDNFIYVYQVNDGGSTYAKLGRCSGHSSFITHVDWSEDSQFLCSNSGDYEVLYWNVSSCKQITNPSTVRDTVWFTQFCTLGFNVAGIWPEGADGTDVNNCCRSHRKEVVATADDFGKVNLYKYPCYQPKSSSHSYRGHSSHVTSVNFLYDDSRLISTGGRDMSIMQWELVL